MPSAGHDSWIAALVVPKGFMEVTIGHRWKKGAVHLTSVTYKALV